MKVFLDEVSAFPIHAIDQFFSILFTLAAG
jgi:hypothetical protein